MSEEGRVSGQPSPVPSATSAPVSSASPQSSAPAQQLEIEVRSRVGPRLTRIATRLVDLALDQARPPTYDRPVAVYLGNQLGGSIAAEVPAAVASWKSCAPGTFYGPPVCPISALEVLRSAAVNRTAVELRRDPRPAVCMVTLGRLPAAVLRLDRVVLVPEPGMATCASDFRIELYVDGPDLRAVNLVYTNP